MSVRVKRNGKWYTLPEHTPEEAEAYAEYVKRLDEQYKEHFAIPDQQPSHGTIRIISPNTVCAPRIRSPEEEPSTSAKRARVAAAGSRDEEREEEGFSFGGLDSDFGPEFEAPLPQPSERQSHEARTKAYEEAFAAQRDANAVAALSALAWKKNRLTAHIAAVVEQLRDDVRDLPKRVRCPLCEGMLSVCNDLGKVTLVSFKFVHAVELPKFVTCSSCPTGQMRMNPLWLGYFPASPTIQVCT